MADNIDVTEGSGVTIGADEISSVLYQRVKLIEGADGTNDGDVSSANPLPVSNNIGATPVVGGAGVLAAGVQRVTIATDDECNNLLGTIDADTGTIAGDTTSLDTKVTACNTGAVVLSSGTVTTVSTVTNLSQMSGTAISMDEGALDGGVQRVSLATDDDAVAHLATIASDTTSLDTSVYVDDADWTDNTSKHTLVGGVYQSAPHTVTDGDVSPIQLDVNGKVLESNSAAIAASLSVLDDWDDANFCNVNLNLAGTDAGVGESALDGTELRVTLATDDDGVAHLATIAGDTTNIEKCIMGNAAPTIDSYTSDDVNLAADTAEQSIVAAPGVNKQIWIYGLVGTVDVAGSISIQDEDDTAHSGVMPVGITGGFVMNPSGNFAMPWIKAATNKAVEIDTVTCTFDGIVTYAIVSV